MFTLNAEQFELLTTVEQGMFVEEDNDGVVSHVFKGVIPTDKTGDVDRVMASLKAEREAHKESKKTLAEQIEELKKPIPPEKDKGGDPGEDSPTVKALRKQQEEMQAKLEAILSEKKQLEEQSKIASIESKMMKAAEGKIIPEAMSDLLLYKSQFDLTDDGDVVTADGDSLDTWLSKTLEEKPHWVPKSTPAGASGSKGPTATKSAVKRFNELMAKDSLTLQEQTEATELAEEINK